MSTLTTIVLATEGGIPASSPFAKISVPVFLLIFVGATYMLVRSNLGTKRGYLVTATCLWGFMVIYALFWAFGAPGTPRTTGPQNLPGQPADAYLPVWTAFAPDSLVAEDPLYAPLVSGYPGSFGEVPEDSQALAQEGADEIKSFFTGEEFETIGRPIGLTDVAATTRWAVAENGYPVIAVEFMPTYQVGSFPEGDPRIEEGADPPLTVGGARLRPDDSNLAPEGAEFGDLVEGAEPKLFYGFFDAGAPLFPSLVTLALCLLLFLVHAALLYRDEVNDRRKTATPAPAAERETVGADA